MERKKCRQIKGLLVVIRKKGNRTAVNIKSDKINKLLDYKMLISVSDKTQSYKDYY